MAAQERLVFINIPVRELATSKAFFEQLGFEFNPKFTNDECACMVLSDKAFVMLMVEARFRDFAPRPIGDARETTQHLLAISADERQEVDDLADAALSAGATPAGDPQDYGFMYQRSFSDPDGHVWEIAWMSPEAVEQGPPDMAETA